MASFSPAFGRTLQPGSSRVPLALAVMVVIFRSSNTTTANRSARAVEVSCCQWRRIRPIRAEMRRLQLGSPVPVRSAPATGNGPMDPLALSLEPIDALHRQRQTFPGRERDRIGHAKINPHGRTAVSPDMALVLAAERHLQVIRFERLCLALAALKARRVVYSALARRRILRLAGEVVLERLVQVAQGLLLRRLRDLSDPAELPAQSPQLPRLRHIIELRSGASLEPTIVVSPLFQGQTVDQPAYVAALRRSASLPESGES